MMTAVLTASAERKYPGVSSPDILPPSDGLYLNISSYLCQHQPPPHHRIITHFIFTPNKIYFCEYEFQLKLLRPLCSQQHQWLHSLCPVFLCREQVVTGNLI